MGPQIMILFFNMWLRKYNNKQKGKTMTKKKMVKKTKKKTLNVVDEYNKQLAKKLKKDFSGIKTKNLGDGMMEISFK